MSFSGLVSHAETFSSSNSEKKGSAYQPSGQDRLTLNITQERALQSDSVQLYVRGANGLILVPPVEWEPFPYDVSFRDTVIYDRSFLPVVFDGKILPPHLDFISKDTSKQTHSFHLIPEETSFAPLIKRAEEVQARRRNFYMDMGNIGDVHYNASALKNIPKLNEEDVTKRNFLHDLIATDDAIKVTPIEMEKINPGFIYWTKTGNHSLQVAQNYITHNWSRGGNSNFFIRNDHRLLFNYAKNKITFNNTVEWRLNLQATPSDEIHDVNISEDIFRVENIFGYKAYNNWSYSSRLETKTPFFQSYPINSKVKTSSFLAPLMTNLSIGMGYKLDKKFKSDKKKNLKLNFNLSPLSLNYVYVRDGQVNEKRFGLKEGERSLFEFGSLASANVDFRFSRYLLWTSRFKYFTNYDRTEVEFENVVTMVFTRLLSTTISLNTRFDDNVPKGGQLGYFQMNQLLSFGLNYIW